MPSIQMTDIKNLDAEGRRVDNPSNEMNHRYSLRNTRQRKEREERMSQGLTLENEKKKALGPKKNQKKAKIGHEL